MPCDGLLSVIVACPSRTHLIFDSFLLIDSSQANTFVKATSYQRRCDVVLGYVATGYFVKVLNKPIKK